MANEEHFAILRQGVETWNKWRKENPNLRPDLSGVVLIGNNLIGADFSETILDKSDLSSANLKGANFQKAILIGSKLTLAILEKADLREAILIKANLVSANLAQANLHRADLRWSCFTEDETIIYSRVVRGADDTTLQGATLTCANLSWGKFKGVCLINADLSDAILRETNLRDSRMTGAKLCGAILDGTNLIGANLEGADLGKAQLIGTDLSYAQLRDTDFSEATIRSIILTSVDLRDTRGLELVEHLGPSAVGIDTIYLSKGQIPVKFMRGCGIADNFIEYMGSSHLTV